MAVLEFPPRLSFSSHVKTLREVWFRSTYDVIRQVKLLPSHGRERILLLSPSFLSSNYHDRGINFKKQESRIPDGLIRLTTMGTPQINGIHAPKSAPRLVLRFFPNHNFRRKDSVIIVTAIVILIVITRQMGSPV